ncbi:MAG: DNA mismatch repair endonuclease MutL, partial [Clostridiales bacterium]|nr:DNA mismatch repair endonuclease MutL [Clostridiales bacterium]
MSIEILPQNIAEKIAAGEVVERPCSVVKELVENSIDASATSITVEIENGGTTYIRVTDNGTGMNPEDAEKAFLRHATSKIKDEENLFAISTMGFRGEALYAIGAVSLIELRTKEHDAEAGIHLSMEGGVKSDVFSAAVSDGTSIVVKNLFYNTPARMKFLKTNRTEGAYIEDFVERIALAHTDIAFKLISDGSQKLITGGNGNLNQAVHAIYGADYSKNITDVNYSSDNMKISGVLGNSSVFRSNRNFQTFFVNGRYVKSPLVSNAVEEAHKSHIMVGKHPFFVLNLELPYSEVDINVHPAKTQVKFTNESLVYKTIYWAIKNTLESDYNSANFKQTRHVPQMPDVFPAAKQTGFSFAQKGFSSNGV